MVWTIIANRRKREKEKKVYWKSIMFCSVHKIQILKKKKLYQHSPVTSTFTLFGWTGVIYRTSLTTLFDHQSWNAIESWIANRGHTHKKMYWQNQWLMIQEREDEKNDCLHMYVYLICTSRKKMSTNIYIGTGSVHWWCMITIDGILLLKLYYVTNRFVAETMIRLTMLMCCGSIDKNRKCFQFGKKILYYLFCASSPDAMRHYYNRDAIDMIDCELQRIFLFWCF